MAHNINADSGPQPMAGDVRFTIQGGSNEKIATDEHRASRHDFDCMRSGRRVRFGALRAASAAAIWHRRGRARSGLRVDRWVLGPAWEPLGLGERPMDASPTWAPCVCRAPLARG